jgi:hypothetical protein
MVRGPSKNYHQLKYAAADIHLIWIDYERLRETSNQHL